VTRLYARAFKRSGVLAEPRASVAAFVVCAPTEQDAVRLAQSRDLFIVRLYTGRSSRYPSVAEAEAYAYSAREQMIVDHARRRRIAGTPAQCRERLVSATAISAVRTCGNIGTVRHPIERGHPMSVKRLNAGPRMSGAVVNGSTVYLAGQVAEGPTVKAQTEAVLKKIDDLLAAAGSSKANLLSTTIYLADIRTFDEMNAVWDAWVSPGNTPARATVEARLANPKFLVEIMVTAAV
jgi:enamine deaminase RidA (YjgF/YER057c/UK114 family)